MFVYPAHYIMISQPWFLNCYVLTFVLGNILRIAPGWLLGRKKNLLNKTWQGPNIWIVKGWDGVLIDICKWQIILS